MYCQLHQEDCIACGLCQLKAPNVFDYDDEGIVLFKQDPTQDSAQIPTGEIDSVKDAIRHCPTRAIAVIRSNH